MAVIKQCASKGCKASPRCDHPWWFDVMHKRRRYRMPVDAFALVRGATQPVSSKQEAEKVWEPKFIGEIVSGRDPRKPPAPPAAEGMTVADFLDQYYERYVVAESLRSIASIRSRLAAADKLNCAEHAFAGAPMRDRIIGALETGCRLGEMLKIQNRHVFWNTHQISIPAEHAKDAESRRIPFEPRGRLAQLLKRRRF